MNTTTAVIARQFSATERSQQRWGGVPKSAKGNVNESVNVTSNPEELLHFHTIQAAEPPKSAGPFEVMETLHETEENDDTNIFPRDAGCVNAGREERTIGASMHVNSPLPARCSGGESGEGGGISAIATNDAKPAIAAIRDQQMQIHKQWCQLIGKQGLAWFNCVPDEAIFVSVKAVREAKNSLQVRYLGWQTALSRPLPARIAIKNVRIVDMAAMDLGGTSDPYCVLRFLGQMHTTDIIKETLEPVWRNLGYEYTVYDSSHVMSIGVWDWDDGSEDDLIGRCYLSAEDLLRSTDHEISRPLINDAGALQGQLTMRVLCESLALEPEDAVTGRSLPSDEAAPDAFKAAALAHVLWSLGAPRAKASQIMQVILKGTAPLHVIQRLGDAGACCALYSCRQNWLVDVISRWKLYTDLQMKSRERLRKDNAPTLRAGLANSWDDRLRTLHDAQNKQPKSIRVPLSVSKYINLEEGEAKGNKEENLKHAQAFCARAQAPGFGGYQVHDPEKAAELATGFENFYGHLMEIDPDKLNDTLALDLSAELLAKFEQEARLVDEVQAELDLIQTAVKAEQGPEGLGLVPHGDQKKGMAYKWLRHKSDMEKEKKYMPLEFYLEPFLKEYVKDEMHKMRQTCVDLGDYFMKHSTPKIRREIAPVIFTIAKTAHEKFAAIEEEFEKQRRAQGKLGAALEKQKREEQDENVNACRMFLDLREEEIADDVQDEMYDLLAHWKLNLMWSMSASVALERERVEARLLELRQKEVDRWQAEEDAAELAAMIAAKKAEELLAAQTALQEAELLLAETEASGDVGAIADAKKAMVEKRRALKALENEGQQVDEEQPSSFEPAHPHFQAEDTSIGYAAEKEPIPYVQHSKPSSAQADSAHVEEDQTTMLGGAELEPMSLLDSAQHHDLQEPVEQDSSSQDSGDEKTKSTPPVKKKDAPKKPAVSIKKTDKSARTATAGPREVLVQQTQSFQDKIPRASKSPLGGAWHRDNLSPVSSGQKFMASLTTEDANDLNKSVADAFQVQADQAAGEETNLEQDRDCTSRSSEAIVQVWQPRESDRQADGSENTDFEILELPAGNNQWSSTFITEGDDSGDVRNDRGRSQSPTQNLRDIISPERRNAMSNDIAQKVCIALMKIKREQDAPMPDWRKVSDSARTQTDFKRGTNTDNKLQALTTIVTWRERVFLVWKPKTEFLRRKAAREAELSKPRPSDIRKQAMAKMSAEIFSSYLEGIKKTAQAKEMDEKSHVAQDVAEDSSVKRHRGAEKHKKRLAQSHAYLMKPSRSSLPFDFLSYCVSDDTLVFQKELNRDAKFVTGFRWQTLFAVPEELPRRDLHQIPQSACGEGQLLSVCVSGGADEATYRLFTIWSDVWQLVADVREHFRDRSTAMKVPFYFRVGETVPALEGTIVLVKSCIPMPHTREVDADVKGIAAPLPPDKSQDIQDNELGQVTVKDMGNREKTKRLLAEPILPQTDMEKIFMNTEAQTETDVRGRDRNRAQVKTNGRVSDRTTRGDADSLETRRVMAGLQPYLKSSHDALRAAVFADVVLLQSAVRRCLAQQLQFAAAHSHVRQLVYHIVDAAVLTSDLATAAFESMVLDDLLADGSLPSDSAGAVLARSGVPLSLLAPGCGVDWEMIVDTATELRDQAHVKQVRIYLFCRHHDTSPEELTAHDYVHIV